MRPPGRHLGIVTMLGVFGMLMFASDADARITKIQITTKESPTFGGYSWPGVGQYEKIVGKAFGEVDPTDAKNSVIVAAKSELSVPAEKSQPLQTIV